MKLKLLTITCLIVGSLCAQNNFEGIVADIKTKEPLPFVNIGIINKNIGTVSNPNGFFNIPLNNPLKEDSIRFSIIGYKSVCRSVFSFSNEFRNGDTILLEPEDITLPEVVLIDKNWTHKTLGCKTKSKRISAGFSNNELGNEVGVVIPIKNSPTVLKSFNFHINQNLYDSIIFRVNIYSLNNGIPERSLLTENIIIQTKIKSGQMKIDLRKYNIWVEEDFYIGLEMIQDHGNSGLFFSAKLLNGPIISRQTSQGEWNQVKGVGLGFNVDVKY